MAEHQTDSIPALVGSVLEDARELVREEIALARAEIREEIAAAKTVAVAFSAAAVTALLGVGLLCVALGGALADLLDWPAWAGYGIVALVFVAAAYVSVNYGRRQLAAIRALPETTASVKENLEWMQNKSATR